MLLVRNAIRRMAHAASSGKSVKPVQIEAQYRSLSAFFDEESFVKLRGMICPAPMTKVRGGCMMHTGRWVGLVHRFLLREREGSVVPSIPLLSLLATLILVQ